MAAPRPAARGAAQTRWRPGLIDVLPVALLALPALMDAWWSAPGTRAADGWTYLLVGIGLLALLLRRRRPVAVAVLCAAAQTGLTLLGHSGELLPAPTLVALYDVAARGDRRRTGAAAVAACSLFGFLGAVSVDPLGAAGGTPVIELLLPLVPLSLGEAARSRPELLAATRLAHEAKTAARLADERGRLAREVHDVVGHTLAGVTVQLAAAQTAFDLDQPETARVAVVRARANATEAMRQLRSTVEGLRAHPTTPPVPDLTGIDDLVVPLREAGIAVGVANRVPGGTTLSPAVALVAHRVVQESVTNIARHSGARRARVGLDLVDGRLEVHVEDDGVGSDLPASARTGGPGGIGGGIGLSGMRERVHAAGGTIEVGPRSAGGFRVWAVLPLEGPATEPAGLIPGGVPEGSPR